MKFPLRVEAILIAQIITHVAGFTVDVDGMITVGHGYADLYEVKWTLTEPCGRLKRQGHRTFKRPLRAAFWFAWLRRQADVGFDTTFPELREVASV